ncbi:MAG TPA: phosphodiester glycosidase family protein, partial [Bacteroidia bacterium]|nr:phosphodiester glycosidase family protein [Bacteroidia bacterium]
MKTPKQLGCLLIFLGLAIRIAAQSPVEWQQLDHGLELGIFQASQPSIAGDRKIRILRIDPAKWQFQLLAAADHEGKARTAREWASKFGMVAAVNAGMFQMDGLTNVGYMKVEGKVYNPRFNGDNTIVAFGTDSPKLPQFQIIDRECQNWRQLLDQYKNATQGIRMVDCKQQNRWSQQPRIWSMVVIGMDKSGKGLFISCRSPYSVHDFIDMLLGLDIDLHNAMYLEGGPEASFFLKTADCEIEQFGSYETGFFESDANDRAWPIPNVIGI